MSIWWDFKILKINDTGPDCTRKSNFAFKTIFIIFLTCGGRTHWPADWLFVLHYCTYRLYCRQYFLINGSIPICMNHSLLTTFILLSLSKGGCNTVYNNTLACVQYRAVLDGLAIPERFFWSWYYFRKIKLAFAFGIVGSTLLILTKSNTPFGVN